MLDPYGHASVPCLALVVPEAQLKTIEERPSGEQRRGRREPTHSKRTVRTLETGARVELLSGYHNGIRQHLRDNEYQAGIC